MDKVPLSQFKTTSVQLKSQYCSRHNWEQNLPSVGEGAIILWVMWEELTGEVSPWQSFCVVKAAAVFPRHVSRHWFPCTPGKEVSHPKVGVPAKGRQCTLMFVQMGDFISSSKASVWASSISQDSFNWCLISCFHILFYFPRVLEALNFEGFFWTGKYFSPPALLKSWPWTDEVCNVIRSQWYEWEIIWYLWWSKERELVCLEGLSSGEWGLSSRRELRNALFIMAGVAVELQISFWSPGCETTSKQQQNTSSKELARQEVDLFHAQDDQN